MSRPKPKISLHIGAEKTATTSIQYVMDSNRSLLLDRGVLYPRIPGEQSHVGLAIYAASGWIDDLKEIFGLDNREAYEGFLKHFPAALAEEVVATPADHVVISNEHCFSRIRSVEEVAKIRDLLLPLASEFRILLYVRRQDQLFLSSYSTAVKSGHRDPIAVPEGGLRSFNYVEILEPWESVFGRERVTVRVYDEAVAAEGGVIGDFLRTLAIPASLNELARPDRPLNRRLDSGALEYLRRLNQYIRFSDEGKLNPLHEEIVRILENIPGDGHSIIASPDMRAFMAQYDQSNSEIARRYLGRDDGVLFATVDREDKASPQPLDLSRSMSISAEVMTRLWRKTVVEPGALAETTQANLRGRVDHLGPSRVAGWAWDPADPGARLVVTIEAEGAEVARVTANRFRPDLLAAGIGDGAHAFDAELPGGGPSRTDSLRCVVGEHRLGLKLPIAGPR